MKLVFATNNQHKLDEVRKITAGYAEIISLSDIQNVVIANDMAYDLTSFAESHPETAATWNEESREYSTINGKLVQFLPQLYLFVSRTSITKSDTFRILHSLRLI